VWKEVPPGHNRYQPPLAGPPLQNQAVAWLSACWICYAVHDSLQQRQEVNLSKSSTLPRCPSKTSLAGAPSSPGGGVPVPPRPSVCEIYQRGEGRENAMASNTLGLSFPSKVASLASSFPCRKREPHILPPPWALVNLTQGFPERPLATEEP
jgi:hypothetical protein